MGAIEVSAFLEVSLVYFQAVFGGHGEAGEAGWHRYLCPT